MPLSIQQTPDNIALSRNDMIYSVLATDNTGNPYAALGARSTFEMNGGGFLSGETIVVNYIDEIGINTSVTFTAVASPSSDEEIPAYISGLITAHYDDVLSKIGSHPDLQPFLILSGNYGSSFILQSVSINTNSNIIVSIDVSGVSSAFNSVDYPASQSTAPTGYEVLVELLFEDVYNSGVFRKVSTIGYPPGDDGMVYFNICNIIDDEIRKSFSNPPIPPFDASEPYIADILRKYKFRYRENWVGNTTSVWQSDNERKVLCGGISQNLHADYNFLTALNEDNSLLTWTPNGKIISPNQREWIAWYNYTGSSKDIMLRAFKTSTTNGLETTSLHYDSTPLSVGSGEVALIPVGYNQLSIAGDIQHYSVQVFEAPGPSDPLSQKRSFYVDHSYIEEERFIMYLNGFCCPETIRCIGVHSIDLEVTREKSNHVLSPNYDSLHSEIKQHDQEFTNYFTYRTGFIRKVDADALQEWIIYNNGFEIYEEGYIPLDIEGKKFSITESRQTLHAYAITARPRMMAKNYSNINIPLSVEQSGWATTDGSYWKTVFGTTWQIA